MPRKLLAISGILALLLAMPPGYADYLFVSNERSNTVTVLDPDTLKIVETIPTGGRPRGMVVSPNDELVYVAAGVAGQIDVIDVDKLKVVRSLDSGPDPELLDIAPTGKRLYIANENNAKVTVMNANSGEVLAQIPVGVEPEGIAVKPDNSITVATAETTSMVH
ncbi:MAG: beta-propeller fold lactonase family protein, partial [Salinisphaera sp.]|nr:beta-propeller fold lactonase family protein [Salinisphaera sp.]